MPLAGDLPDRQTTIVGVGRHVSPSFTSQQKSPLLYSMCTYDCVATSNTVVLGLISDNNEKVYLEEIKNLENWWQENNLHQNVSKTKEKEEQEEKIPPL